MHPFDWTTKSTKCLVQDEWLTLNADTCQMPDGTEITPYYTMDYADWVNIIALTPDDEIIMIRQYRHGVKQTILEIPCGRVDQEDDSPLTAAHRELLEETGYRCEDLRQTGTMYANVSSHTNLAHTFIGTNAQKVADQSLDESEQIEVIPMSIAEVIALLDSDTVFPTSQHATLFYALRALGRIQLP